MPHHAEPSKRVAILVDCTTQHGRSILQGLSNFMHRHERWACYVSRNDARTPPRGLTNWNGDGIIAMLRNQECHRSLIRHGVPMVNVCNEFASPEMPQVRVDNLSVGCLAGEHFAERGIGTFGYFGVESNPGVLERTEGLRKVAGKYGGDFVEFPHPKWRGENWQRFRSEASVWLGKLPKPVGVLAMDDVLARVLMDECGKLGLRVPEDVAILGIGNDQVLCSLSEPALSSIVVPGVELGVKAAKILSGMMQGEAPPQGPCAIQPYGIVARGSTDIYAEINPQMDAALDLIRRKAHTPITVEDVLEAADMSRRSLEQHFLTHLGRSPAMEIRKVRMERAQTLLADTEGDLRQIARSVGLPSAKSLSEMFKRHTGVSPSAYRKKMGLTG